MNEQFRDDLAALIEKHNIPPDYAIRDMGTLIVVSYFNHGQSLEQLLEYFRILWKSFEKFKEKEEE